MTGSWRLGRRPALDGLRGVAILLVLLSHVLGAAVPAGGFRAVGAAGVSLFFTLSGFLITCLLLEEHRDCGSVSLRRFYVRRARRLFPALGVVLAAVCLIQVATGHPYRRDVLAVAGYVGNWVMAFGGDLRLLDPMWSLGIEEQFYLAWPAVLLICLRWRRGPLIAVVVGIVASTALRLVMAAGGVSDARIYNGTDTQAASLLIGCLLAILVYRGLRPWMFASAVPVLLAGLFAFVVAPSSWCPVLVPTVVPWMAAALIWLACSQRSIWMLQRSWLRYVGRRSYSIYLWHVPMLWLVMTYTARSLAWALVAVMLTFLVAEASWWLVERRFLHVSDRTTYVIDQAPVVSAATRR